MKPNLDGIYRSKKNPNPLRLKTVGFTLNRPKPNWIIIEAKRGDKDFLLQGLDLLQAKHIKAVTRRLV